MGDNKQAMQRRRSWLAIVLLGLAVSLTASGCARRVVARVNGQAITQDELNRRLEAQGGQIVLDSLITRALIDQECRKRGVKESPEEVDGLVSYISKQRKEGGSTLEEMLKQRGQTLDDLKDDLRAQIAFSRLFFAAKDEQKFFKEHVRNYDTASRADFLKLVTKTKAEAEAARARILGGEDFATLARQLSIDEMTKTEGGKTGLTDSPPMAGMPDDPAKTWLFQKAKVGDVSEPFASDYPAGWQIVKLVERIPAKVAKYADVRWRVWADVMSTKAAEADALITKLKKKAKLEILRTRYRPLIEEYKKLETPPPTMPGAPPGAPPLTPGP